MKGSEVKKWLLFLFAVSQTTAQDTGFQPGMEYVTFKDFDVTLTCPVTEQVTWRHGDDLLETETNVLVIKSFTDENSKKLYHCKQGDTNHFFYIYAKVCNNCVEMDMGIVIAAMFGDVVFTIGLIIVVYACAKKKASPAAPQRAAHSRQPSAPPPPEPDYQSLNQATRSRDIYAEAGRRAH